MPGSFVFKPIEANLTRDTEVLGKMNPYCSFLLTGDNKLTSQACMKGGKNPTWSDVLTVSRDKVPSHQIQFELMDKSRILADDIIGGGMINLDEVESMGETNKNYPIYYQQKKVGEILMQISYKQEGGDLMKTDLMGTEMIIEEDTATTKDKSCNRKVFTEQHEVIEPHTFTKNVEVVETFPILKEIEVMEPVKVMKDVEYTEAVPVMKTIEVMEPKVVKKEIEVIEPRVVTKTIEVIENVPVKRQVEVVEMVHTTKEVETMEPQTFHKQMEVTEHIPMMKTVTVSEPVTITKAVEFTEPIITTQTITKEIMEPVVVSEKTTVTVGPETLVGVDMTSEQRKMMKKNAKKDEMLKDL